MMMVFVSPPQLLVSHGIMVPVQGLTHFHSGHSLHVLSNSFDGFHGNCAIPIGFPQFYE
jgi:hypothetical protein